MFESGAQKEVGVKEEVTQAAHAFARIHHKAIAYQLTPLGEHKLTFREAGGTVRLRGLYKGAGLQVLGCPGKWGAW